MVVVVITFVAVMVLVIVIIVVVILLVMDGFDLRKAIGSFLDEILRGVKSCRDSRLRKKTSSEDERGESQYGNSFSPADLQ